MATWEQPFAVASLGAILFLGCRQPPSGNPSGPTRAAPTVSAGAIGEASAAARAFTYSKTSELVKDRALAGLVDALAAETRVESRAIGVAGAPSKVYLEFAALRDAATEQDLLALLVHKSPVVRAYVGEHVAMHLPGAIDQLGDVLEDETPIASQNGCTSGAASVGTYVHAALCESPSPQALAFIRRRAEGSGARAREALTCLARRDGAAAAPIVAKRLAENPKGQDLEDMLRLATLGPSAEACAVARSVDASYGPRTRVAAAAVLGRCNDPQAIARLEELRSVRGAMGSASAELMVAVGTSDARRAELAKDTYAVDQGELLLEARLRSHTDADLVALTEKLIRLEPTFIRVIGFLREDPEATNLMRKLVAETVPGASARVAAMRYLSDVKDAASRAEFRRSLRSDYYGEVYYAIAGIVALDDIASKPELEQLAASDSPAAKDAREALTKLGRPRDAAPP